MHGQHASQGPELVGVSAFPPLPLTQTISEEGPPQGRLEKKPEGVSVLIQRGLSVACDDEECILLPGKKKSLLSWLLQHDALLLCLSPAGESLLSLRCCYVCFAATSALLQSLKWSCPQHPPGCGILLPCMFLWFKYNTIRLLKNPDSVISSVSEHSPNGH